MFGRFAVIWRFSLMTSIVPARDRSPLMSDASHAIRPSQGGIRFQHAVGQSLDGAQRRFLALLESMGLDHAVQLTQEVDEGGPSVRFALLDTYASQWAPDCDTTQLCEKLGLDSENNAEDLEREIVLAMLLGPIPFSFPSYDELASAIRIRRNVAQGGGKTVLAFDTEEAERPTDCWTYSEARGFTLLPGWPLIESLKKTTQPGASGKLYSFSCYRATEYVVLLGIARELAECNPSVFAQLQTQWETRALMAEEFQSTFLREHGTLAHPLPFHYYVPGDRLWFRNPDERSANIEGYEGSWVFYIGGGFFTNFWKPDQHYTLTSKCVELFHWRNAVVQTAAGKLQIDENIVEERVRQSLRNPAEVAAILKTMMRLREPTGIYREGGCIDATREYVRCVCPGTSELVFPGNVLPLPA
ncbi:hypothetical protein EDC26_106169 [Paralcaligenes ureilyticus]|uniref:Uncharacterized protein n=2 Tax=Paralcaligenes ureilyticus TaxID=627131 RepID=A0A4R3M7Y5_9BURK|nr:hypothetical protein EDC26_106169 [Paralcaligenes ureilyticus]